MNEKWSQRSNMYKLGKCICFVTCLRLDADVTKAPSGVTTTNGGERLASFRMMVEP